MSNAFFFGSLELRAGVDVALEGAVVNIGAVVVQEGQHGLVHGSVPLNVPWESVSVSVHVLVVLMVDWSLASSPLAVRIGHRWVLGQHAAYRPVEQVWVIDQCLGVERMIVEHQGAISAETTADTPNNEVHDPAVGKQAPRVEVLDGQFTNDGETENDTNLGPGRIVCPVEVRLVSRSCDHAKIVTWEPTFQNGKVVLSLRSQFELTLFKDVLADTETDKFAILDVFRGLWIDSSPLAVIVSVLKSSSKTGNTQLMLFKSQFEMK